MPIARGQCHGDIGWGRLARVYASREGDMSWLVTHVINTEEYQEIFRGD
jgi:hypothetical protein